MSTTARATEAQQQARPAPLLPLALIVLCALIRPGFMIYTEHLDGRFAEQPFSRLLEIGLVASFVIVPAVLMVLLARTWTWTTIESVALLLLPVGWLVPLFLAPMSLGCSDVGGPSQPCGVSTVSGPREAVVLVTSALVVSIAVWLAASPRRRRLRPLRG